MYPRSFLMNRLGTVQPLISAMVAAAVNTNYTTSAGSTLGVNTITFSSVTGLVVGQVYSGTLYFPLGTKITNINTGSNVVTMSAVNILAIPNGAVIGFGIAGLIGATGVAAFASPMDPSNTRVQLQIDGPGATLNIAAVGYQGSGLYSYGNALATELTADSGYTWTLDSVSAADYRWTLDFNVVI